MGAPKPLRLFVREPRKVSETLNLLTLEAPKLRSLLFVDEDSDPQLASQMKLANDLDQKNPLSQKGPSPRYI